MPLGAEQPVATPTPALGNNFAGLSLGSNDNTIVNVYMVEPSEEEAESLARQHLETSTWQNIREVRPFRVKYSKAQLDSWFRVLGGYLGGSKFPELTSAWVDVWENTVLLGVECGAVQERVEASIRDLMGPHNIPSDAVDFEVSHRARVLPKPAPPYIFDCLPAEEPDPSTGLTSPGFGGFYFESGAIHVYLIEPSHSVAIELAMAYFGRNAVEEAGEVRAVQGQFTWEQLLDWYTLILDGSWWEIPGAVPCDADAALNRITPLTELPLR